MSYSFEPHSFGPVHPYMGNVHRFTARMICARCGLLRLRNALTDWCVSKGCNFRDHPGFTDATRRLPAVHRGEVPG